MPRRTNEFQQLIFMLERQLKNSATVEQSQLLPRRTSGDLAEVDIVITSDVGGLHIVVGIECTAAARPATVEWIDQMYGKHQDLPIDKTVLVSRSGFTEGAVARATSRGLVPWTIEEATDLDWTQFIKQMPNLLLGRFDFSPGEVRLTFLDDHVLPVDAGPESSIHTEGDPTAIPMREYILSLISSGRFSARVMKNWSKRDDRPEEFMAHAHLKPNSVVELEDAHGARHRILAVDVDVQVKVRTADLQITPGRYSNAVVAIGSAKNVFADDEGAGEEVLVSFIERPGERARGSLLIPRYQDGDDKIIEMEYTEEDE